MVGSSYQVLESPNNATYIGSGKVAEVARTVATLGVDTVIFDDELSPGQLRNLEKAFSGEGREARVADRTALILDIFSQRARTREGMLQVGVGGGWGWGGLGGDPVHFGGKEGGVGGDAVVIDDKVSPGQLQLGSVFSGKGREARVADRTALIMDIFSQRARTSGEQG